jgi:acyl-coenzyme A synthetase/AMP-(fatty) acid ligase
MLNQSSGTTGAPKSFLHSHAEMLEWMERNIEVQGWSREERFLCLSAMCFSDCRNISLCMLRLGATVVVKRARSLDELTALVRHKRISYLKLTPSHLIPLLDYAADKAPLFPGMRAMVVASAPVTHLQRLAARERLTPNFCEQLGSNETGPLVFGKPADQDAYPEAVGRVVDGVEAQIVDNDDRPVPAGEVGLTRFRGSGYPTRYLDDPDATARAFRGGWFYPGDLAALNEEGYLFFKSRADDVINNAGAKFYPIEVETVLLAHPQVSEAAVFGWYHTRSGEVAVACVVAGPAVTTKDLKAFCRQRIAGYKVPLVIELMAELPRNAMGKISKSELKENIERDLAARTS